MHYSKKHLRTRHTDRSMCGQSKKEMDKHVTTEHKEAFDDGVMSGMMDS